MRKHTAALAVMALLSGCNSYGPASTNLSSSCVSGSATPACTPNTTAKTYGVSGPPPLQLTSTTKPQNEVTADRYKEIDARLYAWRKGCAFAMSTPELNEIRNKIEILHDPLAPVPHTYASLDAFPTNADVPLIMKWNELRDACIKQEHEIDLSSPDLTPAEQSVVLQRAAFGSVGEVKVRQLTVALSQQKLTYGEFAQRRYQIGATEDNAALQAAATLNIRDQSSQILEQGRVTQRFTAEIGKVDDYLHSVDARQPRMIRLAATSEFGSQASQQSCGANCSSAPIPEGSPFKQLRLRHGFVVSGGGLGGMRARLVDFDMGTLSVIDFGLEWAGGEAHSKITHRRDIILARDDLAQLRAIANIIWISSGPVPTAQASLDGSWGILLINGKIVRSEQGLGNVGGAGRDLNGLLYSIQEKQLVHLMFENRRMYQLWSCYAYPLGGHAGVPTSYIRTQGWGYSWSNLDDVPPTFPISSSDPMPFRFDVSQSQWTCAD